MGLKTPQTKSNKEATMGFSKMFQLMKQNDILERELRIAERAVKHLATVNSALECDIVKLKNQRVEHLTIRQVDRSIEWSKKIFQIVKD